MNEKIPYTPLSTRLSGSARETEIRLKNIFSGPKKRPPALFLALVFSVCVLCGNLVSCQNAEAESPPPTEMWLDYYNTRLDIPWEDRAGIELPEYPGVTFRWTSGSVSAVRDGETAELFGGMPVWNVFLCDLNGDGLRELCATVSFGSGMIDDHIVVYDYAAGAAYTLWDRGIYDYALSLEDGQLRVTRSEYLGSAVSAGGLALTEDGTLVMTGELTQDAQTVTPDPGYSPISEDEQWLLQTLFEAADREEPFQLPAARLLACTEENGRLLGAACVTDHLENTLILGVMDSETRELDGPVFRCSLPNGVPNVVKYQNQGISYLLYTFNGQMMGQYLGQAGLVRFDANGPTWEWPVEGDIREADSSARLEYQDYWTGHLALLAPGGVDIYETDPGFVWGADKPPSMWRLEHNQYFYYADEEDLPMPVYFQSLMWLNETTRDPGGWRITALLPNERFAVPGEDWDSFTLLAQSDDNRQYLAANLVFPYEGENGRRSYGSLDHAAAYDMGAPGADVRPGDSWDRVRAAFPDLREDGYPVGWDSYLWYCSGDPQTAPAYVFLFENDVLVDIALRPPLGGDR